MTPVEALKVLEDLRRYSVGHVAGSIFTLPALFILGLPVDLFKLFLVALLGGVLGILFFIPLRRYCAERKRTRRGRALAETVPAVGAAKLLDAIGTLVATDGEALASAVEDLKADAK